MPARLSSTGDPEQEENPSAPTLKNMRTNEKRWIEICFAYLVYDLNAQLNNYPFVVEYFELLSDLANEDKQKTLKALQSVTGANLVRISNVELVALAKEFKLPDKIVCQKLHLSATTLAHIKHTVNDLGEDLIIKPQTSDDLIETMRKLLKVQEKLQKVGIRYDY